MKNPGRTCTVCNGNGKRDVLAVFVATDAHGLQWFECADHPQDATHSVGQVLSDKPRSVKRQPIDAWFASIPCPRKANRPCQGDYGIPMRCQWCNEIMD